MWARPKNKTPLGEGGKAYSKGPELPDPYLKIEPTITSSSGVEVAGAGRKVGDIPIRRFGTPMTERNRRNLVGT